MAEEAFGYIKLGGKRETLPSLSRWKKKRNLLKLIWLTEKPVEFDNVQLEVLHEAVHVEEVAHEGHQAVTCSSQSKSLDRRRSKKMKPHRGGLGVGGRGG